MFVMKYQIASLEIICIQLKNIEGRGFEFETKEWFMERIGGMKRKQENYVIVS